VKDLYEDEVTVEVVHDVSGHVVSVNVTEDGSEAVVYLTAKKARRLGCQLIEAAAVARAENYVDENFGTMP
jgi:ribosome-binding factor A